MYSFFITCHVSQRFNWAYNTAQIDHKLPWWASVMQQNNTVHARKRPGCRGPTHQPIRQASIVCLASRTGASSGGVAPRCLSLTAQTSRHRHTTAAPAIPGAARAPICATELAQSQAKVGCLFHHTRPSLAPALSAAVSRVPQEWVELAIFVHRRHVSGRVEIRAYKLLQLQLQLNHGPRHAFCIVWPLCLPPQ